MTLKYRAFLFLKLFGMTHGHLRSDSSEPLSVPVAQNDEEYGPEGFLGGLFQNYFDVQSQPRID